MAKKPQSPRAPSSGHCSISTSTLVILFLLLFSCVSLFYVSSDSNSSISLRQSKADARLVEMEQLVDRLEREVARMEQRKGAVEHPEHGMDHDVKSEIDHLQLATTDATTDVTIDKESGVFVDESSQQWAEQLKTKLRCLRLRKGALYLYHVRKAAGTSMRDVLHHISLSWRVHFYETEGVTLDHSIFDHQGVTSVLTLREPISRILSLYWYEHVGWFHGVLKQTDKCKKLAEWVAAWKDGTAWKTDFITKNPGTVYVEIENYYIKMLIGWKDPTHKIDENDLELAKKILSQFDFIFLTDWFGDDTQIDVMNAVFPGRTNVALGHKIRGDGNARAKLTPSLAADEAAVKEELTKINNYDLQLWDYAQSLMAYRLKLIVPIVNEVKKELGLNAHQNVLSAKDLTKMSKSHRECDNLDFKLSSQQKQSVGVIRPPGHKGPF